MSEPLPSNGELPALSKSALVELCGDIRSRLVETVTRTGGHLASNLGAVELTVALHRVFTSPADRIVWDVGHQSYTHVLLERPSQDRMKHLPRGTTNPFALQPHWQCIMAEQWGQID